MQSKMEQSFTGMARRSREEFDRIGRAALGMSAVLGAGLGLSMKAAIDWETAFVGVTKTVDGSAEQINALEKSLRNMALVLPTSAVEIAGVAEAAGRLGIGIEGIETFTKTMVDLGETTNLTAEQAAESLARFINVMGTPTNSIRRLGSVLVELGNNAATSEKDILEMAQRMAPTARVAGITEAAVLALSASMSEVGIKARAGGTAMQKVFTRINDAVMTGGANLEVFAKVAGTTAQEFASTFKKDGAEAVTQFIEGLNRMNQTGQTTTAVFKELKLTDEQMVRALLATAGAGDLVRQNLKLANDEWLANNALTTEAEKRYATVESQLKLFRNQLTEVGIQLGDIMLPVLVSVTDGLRTMMAGFLDLGGPAKVAVSIMGGMAAASTGVLGALILLVPRIKLAKDALMGMGATGQFFGRNMGRIAGIASGLGIAVAILTYELGKNARAQAEITEQSRTYTDAILEQKGAIGDLTEAVTINRILSGELGESLRNAGADVQVFATWIDRDAEAVALFAKQAKAGIESGIGLGRAFNNTILETTAFGDEILRLYESGQLTTGQFIELMKILELQANAYQEGKREADNKAAADAAAGDSAADAAGDVEILNGELEEGADITSTLADAYGDLEDAIKAVERQFEATMGPGKDFIEAEIEMAEATDKLVDEIIKAKEKTEEGAASFDIFTEAGRKNRENFLKATVAIVDHGIAMFQNGRSAKEATDATNFLIEALVQQAIKAGLSEDAVREMIAEMNLTPRQIETIINTNASAVGSAIDALNRKLVGLPAQVITDIVVRTGYAVPGLANGGIVEGPTLALIGEAGRELVLPLTNMQRTAELLSQAGLVQPMNDSVGAVASSPLGGGGGATTVINEYVTIRTNADPAAVATVLDRRQKSNGTINVQTRRNRR